MKSFGSSPPLAELRARVCNIRPLTVLAGVALAALEYGTAVIVACCHDTNWDAIPCIAAFAAGFATLAMVVKTLDARPRRPFYGRLDLGDSQ